MDEGPRYPGSLVVAHVRQRLLEAVDTYRRRRKRATELPRVVSLLLAWEGALVAGAFLGAIAYVGAGAYGMERHEERCRRASVVRYYADRCALSGEALRDLQASLSYTARHAVAVQRQLEASEAAAAACRQRLAARRRELEAALECLHGGGGGSGGGGGGGVARRLVAAAIAPWREMWVRWHLHAWAAELQALHAEASHTEASLRHDTAMAAAARAKLARLASQLAHEAAVQAALSDRLDAWRAHRCRSNLLVASGTAWGGAERRWEWSLQLSAPAWAADDDTLLPPPTEEELAAAAAERAAREAAGGGGEGGGGGGVAEVWAAVVEALGPLLDGGAGPLALPRV